MVKTDLLKKVEKIEKGEIGRREYPTDKQQTQEFRKQKIKAIPKNEQEQSIQDQFIEMERPKNYDHFKKLLGRIYEDIISILKNYVDMKEEYYDLIATWIIGTYFHKQFNTYPYLFINAMRGCAKTRTLKLITKLSWNGDLLTSIREAVLFRCAGEGTMAIDELEGIMKKENDGLRELLNAGYKKGIKVKRMRKKRSIDGDQQVVEEFEPYTPIIIANIWGMEEVLADRCITIILEKSTNSVVTKKAEDYDNDILIESVKNNLNLLKNINLVQLCSYFGENNIYTEWNNYINMKYNYTHTYNTYTTQTTQTTAPIIENKKNVVTKFKQEEFFNKIDATEVNGRNLELFMPLFIVAKIISDDIFEKILVFAKELTKQRKSDEMTESRDVMLLQFIMLQESNNFLKVIELTEGFRRFVHDDEHDYKWVNSKWLGRALKRLNLIIDKRRLGQGIEVILDTEKAKEKLKVFQ